MAQHNWIEEDLTDKKLMMQFMEKFICTNPSCGAWRLLSMNEEYYWFDKLGNIYCNEPPRCGGKLIDIDDIPQIEYFWIDDKTFVKFISEENGHYLFEDYDTNEKFTMDIEDLINAKLRRP